MNTYKEPLKYNEKEWHVKHIVFDPRQLSTHPKILWTHATHGIQVKILIDAKTLWTQAAQAAQAAHAKISTHGVISHTTHTTHATHEFTHTRYLANSHKSYFVSCFRLSNKIFVILTFNILQSHVTVFPTRKYQKTKVF